MIELQDVQSDGWGLCFPEDADQPYHSAAVFWREDVDASVCPIAAVPASNSVNGLFDIAQITVPSMILVGPAGDEHLLLRYGGQRR